MIDLDDYVEVTTMADKIRDRRVFMRSQAQHQENMLTREQAIKRVKDLKMMREIDHLKFGNDYSSIFGAIAELMAIFDIKEEELN